MLRRHGLRIPEDISVCGYDGLQIASLLSPKLTTVWQDTTTIGRYAAEKLISLIENPKTTLIEHIIVPGRVVPGETVADINGKNGR